MDVAYLHEIREYELLQALMVIGTRRGRLLEIGAGTGYQAKRFVEEGFSVEAIDIGTSIYANDQVFPVTEYDGHKIPFDDDTFDIVFSSNVLEHIPHLDEFQKEIQRVLKADGMAVHVLPTSYWRIWTLVTHYPNLIKKLFIRDKKIHLAGSNDHNRWSNKRSSLLRKILKNLFPTRHGERGGALSEIFYFSSGYWREMFIRTGWKVAQVIPSNIYYSGNVLCGGRMNLPTRQSLSALMGSSSAIYVLHK